MRMSQARASLVFQNQHSSPTQHRSALATRRSKASAVQGNKASAMYGLLTCISCSETPTSILQER